MKFSLSTTSLDSLTDEQLDQNLRALREGKPGGAGESDELRAAAQELEVRRIELEMQQRMLREVRAELEQAVQRYADLYDHLPWPYLTLSRAGQIVSANRVAAEWLQSDRRGVVGCHFRKYLDAYDAGRFAAHLEHGLQHGGPSTIDLTLRLSLGQEVAVQCASRRALAPAGTEPQLIVAITDISKLKQSQRVLDEVNREQEAFNYSISHDLRAPLVTINNYASIVLSDFGAGIDPQAKGMIERIRCAAQRMEDTLKRLLDYSAIARTEIVLQPVNLDSIVTDLLIEHRAAIEQQNGAVLVERPLPAVVAARDLVTEVLANLLTNALKYTQPGEAPKVQIRAEASDGKVVVRIVDQGIGIEAKHHERVFKVFERLHGYSRYPGSGVGLAIAKRAVERMNGRIWCESEPGKGSCFSVELPAA